MTHFTAEELVHERRMSDDGADRYWAETLKARERESNAITIPGRALLRTYLGPVTAAIEEFLAGADARPGRNHAAASLLRLLRPPQIALVSLVTVVDGLFGERTVPQLGSAIGRRLEDEYRFGVVKKADPAFWKDLQGRIAHLGPGRRERWIRRRSASHAVLPARWKPTLRTQAGIVCLEAVDQQTRLLSFWKDRGPDMKERHYVSISDEARAWIAEADDYAAASAVVYRPTIEPPCDWEDLDGGGYLTDLVLRRPLARFRGRAHEDLVRRQDPEAYRPVLDGVNRLQGVPWRVNEDVLEVVTHLLDVGGAPLDSLVRLSLPPQPPSSTEEEPREEEWSRWRRVARATHRENDRRDAHRLMIGRVCGLARMMLGGPFWMPHRLDFRGRAYPTPSWLQPQGPDVARGLLRFDQAEPMTPEGWEALMAWGRELGVSLGDVLPGQLEHEEVRAVYRDPLEHAAAWAGTSKPFQALAWYLEVGAALEAGYPHRPFLTSLPCYIDASNNGLQLYALLTGCRDLARLTNVTAGPKQDLYNHVGERAWEKVSAAARDPDHWAHAHALDWVRLFGPAGIPRDCAKRPVMTMPYRVTPWSATDYVRQWYLDTYTTPSDPWGPLEHNQKGPRYLAKVLMESVREACPAAVAGMEWLGHVAGLCADRGVPFRWTSPDGWPVQQEYRQRARKITRVLLGGSVREITVHEESGPADKERQVRAAAPNYVHGVDKAILMRTVAAVEGPISTIHDAFGSTAPRMPALHRTLRETVVDVCVNNHPFDVTREEVSAYIGVDVPEPPRFGSIDAGEVLASEHFFG